MADDVQEFDENGVVNLNYFKTISGYTKFVDRLTSKSSTVDFNSKLGTLGLGLGGEAGEIANLVLKCQEEDSEDLPSGFIPDLIDELGDVFWYATFGSINVIQKDLSQLLNIETFDKVHIAPIYNLESLYPVLMSECGEVADIIKKVLYHGKPYDSKTDSRITNLLASIIDSVHIIAQSVCEITLQDVLNRNVDKLSERYKGYKGLQFVTHQERNLPS